MPRSKKEQSKHDITVGKVARGYERKGYDVSADIKGWEKPKIIHGVRPDVIARMGGHETAVEVETLGSVGSKRDQKQQEAFKDWSKRSQTKHYRRIVIKK